MKRPMHELQRRDGIVVLVLTLDSPPTNEVNDHGRKTA